MFLCVYKQGCWQIINTFTYKRAPWLTVKWPIKCPYTSLIKTNTVFVSRVWSLRVVPKIDSRRNCVVKTSVNISLQMNYHLWVTKYKTFKSLRYYNKYLYIRQNMFGDTNRYCRRNRRIISLKKYFKCIACTQDRYRKNLDTYSRENTYFKFCENH